MSKSNRLPLKFDNDHVYATIEGVDWILDTGAPVTFGSPTELILNGTRYPFAESYMGLDARGLTDLMGQPVGGILGVDLLNQFDCLVDLDSGWLTLSEDHLDPFGTTIPIDEFMGIPILEVKIRGQVEKTRVFFDTGAKITYLPEDSLEFFPQLGHVDDFYPGFGEFSTATHRVPVSLSTLEFETISGSLPSLLAMSLMMGGVTGILGNEIIKSRVVGYFPKRKILCL